MHAAYSNNNYKIIQYDNTLKLLSIGGSSHYCSIHVGAGELHVPLLHVAKLLPLIV